jgi:methionyl-tRNA formyltransferase
MRVLFWGTSAFALPPLRALGDEGHDVVGVVTQPDRPAGRGLRPAPPPVKQLATVEMIPVFQPATSSEPSFLDEVRKLDPEISVVVAYGQLLRADALNLAPRGSINIHGSLLPELRGAAPVHWAIIKGFEETGVTIMQMEAGLDSGPVLLQVTEPIRADESMSDLAVRLSEIGAEALVETLTIMETGTIEAGPQDHSRATYAPKLDREAARLDWSLPALELSRWMRGLDSVPGAWALLNDKEAVKLFNPRVEVRPGNPGEVVEIDDAVGVLIGAGGECVRVRQVQPPGKRRMEAGEWIRGRGVKVGDRFT